MRVRLLHGSHVFGKDDPRGTVHKGDIFECSDKEYERFTPVRAERLDQAPTVAPALDDDIKWPGPNVGVSKLEKFCDEHKIPFIPGSDKATLRAVIDAAKNPDN